MTVSPDKKKPALVVVPGASQNPAHYAHLLHLLLSAGYGALTGLLPSIGAQGAVTAADDADYVRNRLLLPLLDVGNQDVILISHSYGGMPASAAARGLGPADRAAQGKSTSVLGQIFIAAILSRGGDGLSIIDSFGGHLPPHLYMDKEQNLVKCDEPKPPVFYDVEPTLADAAIQTSLSQGLTSFSSPCPEASWNTEAFNDRIAYIYTRNDRAVPYEAQMAMVQATGAKWITRELATGHSAQLSAPEDLTKTILEVVKQWETI
ncbi:alpha/beta hydrolase [Aspergillus homomorphus CBS 101889]|uniref:Alpha/beta-hydrolase n=1 Tax=Aspergillus homomorphus (strain CBS 101889) TaxID=1450537 RepID=A0A395HQ56_ASPHC|nr:alpha/beta-hydrolase [Aspergillus homomorphus CBS 101889]RAL09573.1 alpha/beta-hydrolase [Aspergillus homomorphus CBS 101889]